MALVDCKICGKPVADNKLVKNCPHCGATRPMYMAGTTSKDWRKDEWSVKAVTITIPKDILEWLDDENFCAEMRAVGLKNRSSIVQRALSEFYQNHVTADTSSKVFHYSANSASADSPGTSYNSDSY